MNTKASPGDDNDKEGYRNIKMTLSVNEAVEVSGIGRNKILHLIKNDPKFPYIRIGTRYKINREMLQEYLNEATRMNRTL